MSSVHGPRISWWARRRESWEVFEWCMARCTCSLADLVVWWLHYPRGNHLVWMCTGSSLHPVSTKFLSIFAHFPHVFYNFLITLFPIFLSNFFTFHFPLSFQDTDVRCTHKPWPYCSHAGSAMPRFTKPTKTDQFLRFFNISTRLGSKFRLEFPMLSDKFKCYIVNLVKIRSEFVEKRLKFVENRDTDGVQNWILNR